MKQTFKVFIFTTFSIVILFSFSFIPTSYAVSNCATDIKSGWNLIGLAELTCAILKIDSDNNTDKVENFPAYLDIYGYDGSEYIHARVTKQNMANETIGSKSIGSAIDKYGNKLVSRITSGQITKNEDFMVSAEQDIKQNNTQKIKEYAGRLVKEIFTSVWVYNPGKDFKIGYSSKNNDDEFLIVPAINLLSTDLSSSELSKLVGYIEDKILPNLLRALEKEEGYSSFFRELVSGKIILDSGWSFLSYSKLLSDDNGNLNLNSGTCNISKAYLFDNNSKKWINIDNAERSMFGAGLVVYNSGAKCNLAPSNNIIEKFKAMFRDGSDNNPPILPN